ncbi:hypothetical protein ES707_15733 [subsurface metagenome]
MILGDKRYNVMPGERVTPFKGNGVPTTPAPLAPRRSAPREGALGRGFPGRGQQKAPPCSRAGFPAGAECRAGVSGVAPQYPRISRVPGRNRHHISTFTSADHLRHGCRRDLDPFISSGNLISWIFQTVTSSFSSGAAWRSVIRSFTGARMRTRRSARGLGDRMHILDTGATGSRAAKIPE